MNPTDEGQTENVQRLMPRDHPWDFCTAVGLSHGLRIGKIIYVSGQVSITETGEVKHPGDIEAQTGEAYENIRLILAEAGATMRDVVKLNTYYVIRGDEDVTEYYRAMTRARLPFLEDPGPTGTAVQIAGLSHPDWLIEVDAIAIMP